MAKQNQYSYKASSPPLRQLVLIMCALALGGCSTLSRDQSRAQASLPAVVYDQWQESALLSSSLMTELLELVDNAQLKALVKETLAANSDLRQTALRLQQQNLVTGQTRASRLPTLDVGLGSQRAKETSPEQIANSHSLSLNLGWEIDVWGRLADLEDAAQATLAAQNLDYQTARHSLAARTIQSWIGLTGREQIIGVEKLWLASLESTEAIIRERYQHGLTSSNTLADLEAARTQTALVKVRLSESQQQQRSAYRQLAVLQGKVGVITVDLPTGLPTVANPPLQLPAEVIARRPDIQSAFNNIVATDADARASHKKLLPSFVLSASLSQDRPHLGDLLSGSAAWNLLGQMTAPLFNGGRLRADAEIADLEVELRYLAYQQTLVNALNEVEEALSLEASLAEQQNELAKALTHSEASLVHFQERYRDGLTNILDLLASQQTVFDIRIQYLQTHQARLTNRITLALALGMGV